MPVVRSDHYPPNGCLKGARALLGLNQADGARALGIARTELAAAEKDDGETSAVQSVMAAYRRLDVAVNVAPQAWIVTRPRLKGESEDAAYGMAAAAARTAAGLTQQMLANSARVSLRTVIALEKGAGAMRSTRDALATALLRRKVEVVNPEGLWGFKMEKADLAAEVAENDPDESVAEARSFRLVDWDPEIPSRMRLRVEIDGTKPLVWRELLIPENATFEDLHRTIQVSFGWRDSHLHEFSAGFIIGPASLNGDGPVYQGEAIDERLAWLYDLSSEVRSFVYIYDFGDRWRHVVTRIGTERGAGPVRPIVTDGACAGPVENSGSYQGWNEMARSLRTRRASEELRNHLQRSGYGRNYDPDSFDIEAVNEHLEKLEFHILSTWAEQSRLRQQVKIDAPFLRPAASIELQRRPIGTKTSKGLRVIEVEEFGEARYETEGLGSGPDEGWSMMPSRKMDRVVTTRAVAAELLGSFLEYAPDVVSFRGFPVRISYTNGVDQGVLIPDYEVSLSDGRKILVHVITEQNVDLLDDHLLLRSALAASGRILAVLPSGLFDANEIKMAHNIHRGVRAPWEEPDTVAADFLRDLVQERTAVPMKEVVRLFLENGLTDNDDRSGTSEMQVMFRILGCVPMGSISIDYWTPHFSEALIGTPEIFEKTMSFDHLVEKEDYRGLPPARKHAVPRGRPKSKRS